MAKINKKNSILWISTVNFGMHDCEAKLKWCEETLEALKTIKDL